MFHDFNYYYYVLYNIHKLFIKKKFLSIIGSKNHCDSFQQKICYYKNDNISYAYYIYIINSTSYKSIELKIPLKYSNYYYKMYFDNIHQLYFYLNKNIL